MKNILAISVMGNHFMCVLFGELSLEETMHL